MFARTRSLISLSILLTLPSLAAAQISGGNTTPGPGNVPVRASFDVQNNTGRDANDFEYCMRSKESFPINGFSASAAPFTGGSAVPDANNGICIMLDGGTVPNGGTITVNTTLFLPEKNRLYLYAAAWTFDGAIIGLPPFPPGGWKVDDPTPGGNGGNPGLPGGQGGGGGVGNFIHIFAIDNDSNEPVTLHDLKLLASMDYYNDLRNDPPWAQVNPINLGAPSVVIPPNSSLVIPFETTGDYLNGHVYHQYQLDYTYNTDPSTSDPAIIPLNHRMFGDHPVTVPEPATLSLLALIPALVPLRRRTAHQR